MTTYRVAALLSFFALMTTSVAWAEEKKAQEGYESYSLGEVYISDEKPPVSREASITNEITAEDMKATNSRTVAEALANTPGMTVITNGRNEPMVSIHGFFDQQRILILIDGVPYYETNRGYLDLNQFSTDNVAKIEVTKGAASVLYGANAEGGVINIITRKGIEKPFFSVNAEGGDVDYYKASASHGMKKGIFNYWLNYEHSQAHGWRMSDDFRPVVGTSADRNGGTATLTGIFEDGGTRSQSSYSKDSVWAKFGIEPSAGSEYSLNFHYITRDKPIPGNILNVMRMTKRPAFTNFFGFNRYDDWGLDLSGQQKLGDKVTMKGKIFYHNHADAMDSYSDWNYNNIIARSSYFDYMVGGSLITEWRPVSWNKVSLSLNYRGDSHKERTDDYLPYADYFAWTGSVGIEDEVSISKNFSIVVGGSYDWFKVTDANKVNTDKKTGDYVNTTSLPTGPTTDSFNPMIGATYLFPDTTKLFASVARKTRMPTLRQLYSDVSTGSYELQPESAINSTIGVSRTIGEFMWGQLSFFYHDISDMIVQAVSGPYQPYENLGSVEIYGIEVATEFYPMKDMVLKFGYNYNHATDQTDGRATEHVVNVPEHKLDMGLQYTVPYIKTRLDLNGILLSDMYTQLPTPTKPTTEVQSVAGYFLLNMRISQKFLSNYEAYIAFNNICDRNYYDGYGLPARGRNIFGGITARF